MADRDNAAPPEPRRSHAQPVDFVQQCYITRDLEGACRRLSALLGAGPFLGGGELVLDQHVYRGRLAGPIRLRGVFGCAGETNLEILQILSDGPCAFTDMFPGGGEGMHHTAHFCTDYVAERDRLVEAGFPVASEFTMIFGAKICYIDTRAALGHMIELYPDHAVIRDMFAQARDAAQGWDGTGLMRPFAME